MNSQRFMQTLRRLIICIAFLLISCGASSYDAGADYARSVFASHDDMLKDPALMSAQIREQARASADYVDFINGYCDEAAVLMWRDMQKVNEQLGSDMFNQEQLKQVVKEMRQQLLTAEHAH